MPLTNRYELKFARVNATSDTPTLNVVIAPVAGKTIYVLGYALGVNATGVVTLQSSEGTPTVLASFELVDGGGVSYAGGEDCPAFRLPKGFGLDIVNAAGVDTSGHLTYITTV